MSAAVNETMKDGHHSNGMMSRPSSASSASSRSSSHRGKVKEKSDKGPRREEITQANVQLSTIENLTSENNTLKTIVGSVIDKLVENARIKGVTIPADITENTELSAISIESLISFTEKLTSDPPKANTMEFRVEELETRITHLNTELAKLLKTRMYVENGLEDILNDMDYDIEKLKLKARDLQREIRSTDLFTFLHTVPPVENTVNTEVTRLDLTGCSVQEDKPRHRNTVVLKEENLNLIPPAVKMPGDTHIKKMHADLRQYVIQQLSFTKGNGADWRMMGERLGIPPETINQLKRWKIEQPMFYVLQSWSQSTGATVRILHRHLVSPQMRCTLLAKRISDFYKVD